MYMLKTILVQIPVEGLIRQALLVYLANMVHCAASRVISDEMNPSKSRAFRHSHSSSPGKSLNMLELTGR